MAFIRRSGIAPLVESLSRHCAEGRRLRVLTTTYTGSTEKEALDQLKSLGAEVRISYDVTSTRLHAKAWLFHRYTGFSTGYIGSSNLTYSAQVTGLEWNVRASSPRNQDVLSKFEAVFESYWESNDFIPYDPDEFIEETKQLAARRGPVVILAGIELRPEPFQERLLELIELARQQGHHRNLLVSATGTGKTVMAALDYSRLRETPPRSRLPLRGPSRRDSRSEHGDLPLCPTGSHIWREVGRRISARAIRPCFCIHPKPECIGSRQSGHQTTST